MTISKASSISSWVTSTWLVLFLNNTIFNDDDDDDDDDLEQKFI